MPASRVSHARSHWIDANQHVLIAKRQVGVVMQSALELRHLARPAAEHFDDAGRAQASLPANLVKNCSRRDGSPTRAESEELTRDLALQAAHDLPVGLAFGPPPQNQPCAPH